MWYDAYKHAINKRYINTMENTHVAYMTVMPAKALHPGTVVRQTGSKSSFVEEASHTPHATDEGAGPILGVADRFMPPNELGTIVIAGITTIYCAEDTSLPTAGQYVTSKHLPLRPVVLPIGEEEEPPPLQVIGTVIKSPVEGKVKEGKYLPGVKIFLCPWLNAASLPVKVDVDGAGTTSDTQLNLSEIMTTEGYKLFIKEIKTKWKLNDELDPVVANTNLQQIVASLQTALLKGLEGGISFLTMGLPPPPPSRPG
jgi:hypothetical protein